MTTNKNVTKSFILKAVINPTKLVNPIYINPRVTVIDIPYRIITIICASIFNTL